MHSRSSHVLLVMSAPAVHELGYTAMPRAFVLPGSRALEPEAAAHLLGLSTGQRWAQTRISSLCAKSGCGKTPGNDGHARTPRAHRRTL